MTASDAHDWFCGCDECEAMDEHARLELAEERKNWTRTDHVVRALCRTVGCSSFFARFSSLPYRLICNPLCLWLFRREEAREDARLAAQWEAREGARATPDEVADLLRRSEAGEIPRRTLRPPSSP